MSEALFFGGRRINVAHLEQDHHSSKAVSATISARSRLLHSRMLASGPIADTMKKAPVVRTEAFEEVVAGA
jgi:hypothetical protein